MRFGVWHSGSLFRFWLEYRSLFFFHGWKIPCGSGENKGKVWGHLVPEIGSLSVIELMRLRGDASPESLDHFPLNRRVFGGPAIRRKRERRGSSFRGGF
jgi:hypothetical protein